MRKRILSLLMCCVMLIGLLPTAAFAEGSAEEPPVCSCETACTAEQGGGVYLNGATLTMSENASLNGCNSISGGGNNTIYMDGLGTAAYPYQISTADQLKLFRNIVNGTGGQAQNRGACAVLTNDIVLNDGTFDANGNYTTTGLIGANPVEWTPIGKYTDDGNNSPYTGTFNGQGHTIKGLYVNLPDVAVGLFGSLNGAAVRNLTVDGYVQGRNTVGGIAGKARANIAVPSTIENCRNNCHVVSEYGTGGGSYRWAGGIVGLAADTTIAGCANTGVVEARGSYNNSYASEVAGIVGILYENVTVKNCYNTGEIKVTGDILRVGIAGGIVGSNTLGDNTASDCYNLGAVMVSYNGNSSDYTAGVGGIMGYISKSGTTVSNCYSVGKLTSATGTGTSYIGGVVGRAANGTVESCYYLDSTATKAVGNDGSIVVEATGSKTAAQLGDGTVLALLINNRGDSEHPWNSQCQYLAAADKTLPAFKTQTGDEHTHDWSAWTSNGDGTHSRSCACNAAETVNCSGGTATCTAKAVCEVCKAEYGEKLPHDFTAENVDAKYLKSAATCTEKAVYYKSCAVCGLSSEGTADEAIFFSGNALDHDWGEWTQNSDEKTHTRICKRDTSHTETENCLGGTVTCTAKAVCTVCGGKYGEMAAHSFTAEKAEAQYLKSAATCTEKAVYYKSCAVCGLSSDGTADEAIFFSGNALDHDWGEWTQNSDGKTHTRICKRDTSHTETENCHGGTATCTAKAVCTVCGGKYGEMAAHSFTAEKAEAQYLKSATTCAEKAIYYKSCAVCGLSSEGTADEAIFFSGNALDHNWGAWTSNEDGTHTRTCTIDGCSAGTQTENCIDANKDHKCDICDYIISECVDTNKDHKCDYCGKKLTEHSGGKATCKHKAKCEFCGESYGELNANNHSDLKHFPAVAATKTAKGNIEYWYCSGCKKYYKDATATQEIKQADTVTAKLPGADKSPQTGDNSNLLLWIALLFISGGAAIGTTVVSRKKKYNR